MWDVGTPYEALDGWAAAFFTLPVPKKPVLALRAGGKKLWGPFPYFDAAFLGVQAERNRSNPEHPGG